MRVAALADFGSTFTKITLVEPTSGRLLARAQAPTTVQTDVMDGFCAAMDAAMSALPTGSDVALRLAASSAAGGLRVAAVGLVEDLTAHAAKQAALNAGAKVEVVLAGDLDEAASSELQRIRPEIVLFSGGTDGGQAARVVGNAEYIAEADVDFHAIVACNADVARTVATLLRRKGRRVDVVANVMPEIFTLDVEPAREAIHEAFIAHVIKGKGLSATTEFAESIIMPTPEAVLEATGLLARGGDGVPGVGDAIVVDVGGATTDVHSSATYRTRKASSKSALLPPPSLMRTVQGDLGVRWNAPEVLEVDGVWLEAEGVARGWEPSALREACETRRSFPGLLPIDGDDVWLDRMLATSCVTQALRRHCGTLSVSSQGTRTVRYAESGPDLREVPLVVATGGTLVHDQEGAQIVTAALARREERSLVPRDPHVLVDRNYILAAAGLLATVDPAGALALMRNEVPGFRHVA